MSCRINTKPLVAKYASRLQLQTMLSPLIYGVANNFCKESKNHCKQSPRYFDQAGNYSPSGWVLVCEVDAQDDYGSNLSVQGYLKILVLFLYLHM